MSAQSPGTAVLASAPLQSPWPGRDPFLFCAHHLEAYPAGDGTLGLPAGVSEPQAGQARWRRYHGSRVPGFPAHPHRGFETVTIVPTGLVDHADSLGASARYGQGDVQWLTTGKGVEHGEMFPLLETARDNPLELFQLWLNLPPQGKRAAPAFKVFWAEQMPWYRRQADNSGLAEVEVIAGRFVPVDAPAEPVEPIAPPPDSWAADPANDVAIWRIHLAPGARLKLPAASAKAARRLYVYAGAQVRVDGQAYEAPVMLDLAPEQVVVLEHAGSDPVWMLLLQGVPIGAPVVARGPFVLNSEQELMATYLEYSANGFGAWPWPSKEQTHGTAGRFARYADGRVESPGDAGQGLERSP
jgi:redox-sensitive bicupin YhaK (pirin superfamily)